MLIHNSNIDKPVLRAFEDQQVFMFITLVNISEIRTLTDRLTIRTDL